MKIEYDGSKFVGWQYQKNGKSVQEVIEKALSKFFKSKIKINGAGRTDKGVHAIGQHANFKVSKKIENEKKFLNSINFFLKKHLVSITKIKKKKYFFIHVMTQKREFMNIKSSIELEHYLLTTIKLGI